MSYETTGSTLYIDLAKGSIEREERLSDTTENFLGGRGTNSKIFWDHVSPETQPFSEENLLVIGAGLLTGTLAPAANRTVITTKSPATHLLTYSSMGGFWGPELRYAGYEDIVISGKASTPIYIFVNDRKVEFRDAKELWGKDTAETKRIIRKDLGNEKVQILCIGPAGENKVLMASIEHSAGSSSSRAGVGAIMGDKNIKAIAVCGSNDIHIANPSKFIKSCQRILERSDKLKTFVDHYSENRIPGHVNRAAYGNMGDDVPQWPDVANSHQEFLAQYRSRKLACHNCPIRCKAGVRFPDDSHLVVKCFSWVAFMNACKIQDFSFSAKCSEICEKMGLDSISTANTIAFAIDLYTKGILTKKDTGGIHLQWGDSALAIELIQMLAKKQGVGEILAQGVHGAARVIGRGAEKYAYLIKKLELYPVPLYLPYAAYAAALSDRADPIKMLGEVPLNRLGTSNEEKEAYINSGYFPYPDEYREHFLAPVSPTATDYERQALFLSYDTDKYTIADCTGLCIYWAGHWPYPPIHLWHMAELISYATGKDLDHHGVIQIARRVGNLIRVYNLLSGLRKEDDTVPEKYFRDAPAPGRPPLDRQKVGTVIKQYYKNRGWDENGIPTRATLGDLNLDDVLEVMEKRGVFSSLSQ